MKMFNPPHPGEFIDEVYLKPFDISIRTLASNSVLHPPPCLASSSSKAELAPKWP